MRVPIGISEPKERASAQQGMAVKFYGRGTPEGRVRVRAHTRARRGWLRRRGTRALRNGNRRRRGGGGARPRRSTQWADQWCILVGRQGEPEPGGADHGGRWRRRRRRRSQNGRRRAVEAALCRSIAHAARWRAEQLVRGGDAKVTRVRAAGGPGRAARPNETHS